MSVWNWLCGGWEKKTLQLDLGFEVLVTAVPTPLPLGVSPCPW